MRASRTRRVWLTAAVMAALAAAGVAIWGLREGWWARGAVVRKPGADVLLITLDTTRPDRLGAYGYARALTPEIDRIAAAGVLFSDAHTPAPSTLPAHSSILTGLYPPTHGVRDNGVYVLDARAVTLAKILKAAGYSTAAFVSSFVLDSRFGLAQGFDYYGDRMAGAAPVENLESERRAEATFRDYEEWLGKKPAGPLFAWVHFYDPHAPYDPPEPYRSRLADPYDGEIAYMDGFVGQAARLMRDRPGANPLLVILAADHGEGFGEHGESGHGIFAYEETLRVPLVLSCAAGLPRGKAVPGRADLIDIVPTVLDFLKMKIPPDIQGTSLLPLVNGRKAPARRLYFESLTARETLGCAPLSGLLDGSSKFIDLPKPELYDLRNDREEKANLAGSSPEDIRKLREELRRTRTDLARGADSRRTLTAAERSRLESLGYLAAPTGRPEPGTAYDPKDRIDFWNRSLAAKKLLAERKYREAEPALLALRREDPLFMPAIEDLGTLYFAQKRTDALVSLYGEAVAANPGSAALRISFALDLVRLDLPDRAVTELLAAEAGAAPDEKEQLEFVLANAYGKLGRFDDAARSLRAVLDIEPANFEARRLLGYAWLQLGRYEDALKELRQAEKGLPDDPRLLEDTAMALANLREFPSALAYFERAVQAAPSARVYSNYALACAEMKDYRKASSLMAQALRSPGLDESLRRACAGYLRQWAPLLEKR